MMQPKILFLDLDGTLLNDQKRITAENQQAIALALSRGHRVVIASGRPLKSTLIQAEHLRLNTPGCFAIAYNGAVIYDFARQQEIFRHPMEFDDLYAIFDEANRRKVYIQTYDGDDVVFERRNNPETALKYCAAIDMNFHVIDDVRRDLSEPPVKALAIDFVSRLHTEPLRRWIVENFPGRVDTFFSGPYYLEIVAAGMNKGHALQELCRLLDLPVRNSVAAGDEANDLSMIRAAGAGVAMKNAVPEVRAAADYVTRRDNNHDGVAEIIYHFMLE